ncbi:MAG: ribonuclease HII [Chlamydiales bacterium]
MKETKQNQKLLECIPKIEQSRLLYLIELEQKIQAKGFSRIAGIDEAGRGPLAGPVVAAATVFRKQVFFSGLNDSKLLTPSKRKALYQDIIQHPDLDYATGIVEPLVIDEINILQATLYAMRKAVESLSEQPDYLLIDGNVNLHIENIQSEALIRGDQRSQLIAASSIIAKETRDKLMMDYHRLYPEYGFDQHKGYGTKKHCLALAKYGPSPIHRKTFHLKKKYD